MQGGRPGLREPDRGCGYSALDLNASGENLTFGFRQKRLGPTRSGHCDAEQRMAQADLSGHRCALVDARGKGS
jgi:hypothetical protein